MESHDTAEWRQEIAECLRLQEQHGYSYAQIAEKLGISERQVKRRLATGRKQRKIDPYFVDKLAERGVTDLSGLNRGWFIERDEGGSGVSLWVDFGGGEAQKLSDMVTQAIEDAYADRPVEKVKRIKPQGEHLLVIDLADVHFLKLCMATDTGYEYSRETARHRVLEGTRALLASVAHYPIGRVLYVLGNDSLHIDGSNHATSKGTPMNNVDGTLEQGFTDGVAAFSESIGLCAEIAPVDLVHIPSNHDHDLGWAMSQTIAAGFRCNENVNSTVYNMSMRSRKYYRFGSNLIGLDHGDKLSEEKILGTWMKEVRKHLSECKHLYHYRHHVHHKQKRRRGAEVFQTEKDHIALTEISYGQPHVEGANVEVEYVRSPSAPDTWHAENGYLNAQAVECFIHHPSEGQKARFTEFF